MSSVTFSPSVGGDGSTVTDDTNPSTGLDAGGHRTRFVPALAQVVAVAGNVVTKANEAAASATAAANSANAATTNGAVQVALAAANAAAAQAAANAAEASYDSFDDRYLGAKSSAPTVDNDGNALLVGAFYFNSTSGSLYVWNGSSWLLGTFVPGSASGVTFSPTGNIAATNVQAALQELDSEKLALSGGSLTGSINYSATVSIASATTTDIGAATSNVITITGTTTITGLGTIAAGAERCVTFAGALTLTHNATSLILPGGANITTAAGDVAYFVSLGSGNWRCSGYQKASGNAVISPATGLTATGTAYETIAMGDPLAWRSDGTIEKVGFKYPATPFCDPSTHMVQDCPHVGSKNLLQYGGSANPQYSVLDNLVLCGWLQVISDDFSGTPTYGVYLSVGIISASGQISWGDAKKVSGAGNTNTYFGVVLLSPTLGGVMAVDGTSTAIQGDKIQISGNTITNTPNVAGFALNQGVAAYYASGDFSCYQLMRASSTVGFFVGRPTSGNTMAYAYIDFSSGPTGGASVIYDYSSNAAAVTQACVSGDNGFAAALYYYSSTSSLKMVTVKSGNSLGSSTVSANVSPGYNSLAFDGTRYLIVAYSSSSDNKIYAKCCDITDFSWGSAVEVYPSTPNQIQMAYDQESACFWVISSTSPVIKLTNSAKVITVVGSVAAAIPFYGIVTGNLDAANANYRGNLRQCQTNKHFIGTCTTYLNLVIGSSSGTETPVYMQRLMIIPYAQSNVDKYIGIAEAAASASGSVTYSPDGAVTTKVSGLTANRQAMLSYSGTLSASGDVSAGRALSSTTMQVSAAKNDFSHREVINYTKTWVCPNHVTRIRIVELTGGGAGVFSNYCEGATGGQTVSGYLNVVPGASYSVVIGAGGLSAASIASVSEGGNSSFGGVIACGGRRWVNQSNTYVTPAGFVWQKSSELLRRNGTGGWMSSTNKGRGGFAGSGVPGFGQGGGYDYHGGQYFYVSGSQGVCIIEY